jgi:hypothetical protein
MMKHYSLAVAAVALALPGSALAASPNGVVLSVDRAHHAIEVVDSGHVAHAYHYRGFLPKVHPGSHITFNRSGRTISHVTIDSNLSRTVAFYGRVVRSSRSGLVLRLADGTKLKLSSKQVSPTRHKPGKRQKPHKHLMHAADLQVSAGGITIDIQGLQPGVTILVNETIDQAGNSTITITLPPPSAPGVYGQHQTSGIVTEVATDAFMVQTPDGSDLRLHIAQGDLANLNLQTCDTVDVIYHQDANILVADNVHSTGTSPSGDCTSGRDATGTITDVSGMSLTITTQDQQSMTFTVDSADITSGYQVGDVVDVSYTSDSNGTLAADDVEYVEQNASGTVTSVSGGSMTITDNTTGQPETFVADPSEGMFDGITSGDQVDLTYHQAGGQLVADSVGDQTGGGDGANAQND